MIVVDAENVRRSIWPNVSPIELVAACGRLAADSGREVTVVFDGQPPAISPPSGVRLLGEPGRSADDLIVELAATWSADVSVVATSDRGLRARLHDHAVTFVGGGSFVRALPVRAQVGGTATD